MSVELLYRIVQLTQMGGGVKMVLQEVHLVPPEEIERARLEAEQGHEIDVVDAGEQLAKIEIVPPEPKDPMERMFWAMRKQWPEIVEGLKSAQVSGGRPDGAGPCSLVSAGGAVLVS